MLATAIVIANVIHQNVAVQYANALVNVANSLYYFGEGSPLIVICTRPILPF